MPHEQKDCRTKPDPHVLCDFTPDFAVNRASRELPNLLCPPLGRGRTLVRRDLPEGTSVHFESGIRLLGITINLNKTISSEI